LERDGLVIAALIAFFAIVGVVAALLSIKRAASVDPMQALRAE
jgi:ABC-type antimicrobial peptide transport system permease subunit